MTDSMFDFNAELNKLITGEKGINGVVENHDDECLISKEKLDDTMIKLECGHAFNYEPLYNEIVKQKSGYRATEIVKLQVNQLKCPYCRNIQNKVLPYASSLKLKKTIGVNSPAKWQMLNDRCSYSNNNKRSKYFNVACNEACWGKYCNKHSRMRSVLKSQNVVTTAQKSTSTTSNVVCNCVLKSGERKGQECKGKLFLDNKCKRHYNLANK
jgi:hypothetical protein